MSDDIYVGNQLRRIADAQERTAAATEIMAKSRVEMQAEIDETRRARDFWQDIAYKHGRSNGSLRGVITKLKITICNLKAQLEETQDDLADTKAKNRGAK